MTDNLVKWLHGPWMSFAQVDKERREAADEIERLRVQLAGCSVAAVQGNKDGLKPGDYGYSASYSDVCRLYDELVAKDKEIERLDKSNRIYAATITDRNEEIERLKAEIELKNEELKRWEANTER